MTSNIHVCKTRNRRNHILSTSFGDNSNRIQVLFRFKLVFTITKFFLPVYTPIMELDLREYARVLHNKTYNNKSRPISRDLSSETRRVILCENNN